MKINKDFVKSVLYSNSVLLLLLLLLGWLGESKILNELFFGYDIYHISSGLLDFFMISILLFILIILIFKSKYIKYEKFSLYFFDFFLSFILFFVPIIIFFESYYDVFIIYLLFNLSLAFLFFYLKNKIMGSLK